TFPCAPPSFDSVHKNTSCCWSSTTSPPTRGPRKHSCTTSTPPTNTVCAVQNPTGPNTSPTTSTTPSDSGNTSDHPPTPAAPPHGGHGGGTPPWPGHPGS